MSNKNPELHPAENNIHGLSNNQNDEKNNQNDIILMIIRQNFITFWISKKLPDWYCHWFFPRRLMQRLVPTCVFSKIGKWVNLDKKLFEKMFLHVFSLIFRISFRFFIVFKFPVFDPMAISCSSSVRYLCSGGREGSPFANNIMKKREHTTI